MRLLVDGTVHGLAGGADWAVTTELHKPPERDGRAGRRRGDLRTRRHGRTRHSRVFGLSAEGRIRRDGTPRDLLAMALLTEWGRYYMPMMPRPSGAVS
ncbi:MAG: hypothetical protein EOP32_26225 [Rhodococcus sp. (in: high G+C Gram-positive bacteria)]|nr:MAG: hypothetical protein EOP32_26225 [Rhodococcus sp. (in: high G+C Gram-positive bacteria)]